MEVSAWLGRTALAAAAGLAMASAAGFLSPPSLQAAPPDVSKMLQGNRTPEGPGGAVYVENCAACHETGVDRAPQRMALADMTPEAIHRALTAGAMQAQGSTLTEDQKVQVAEFLSGRKLGADSASAGVAMCDAAHARFDMAEPLPFSGWGLDPASTHSIPAAVSGLDATKAPHLRLKWAFAFPNSSRARSQATIAAGAILVGNHNGTVYALDRETGCVRWHFQAMSEVRTGIVVSPWRKGDRRAHPLVHFGDVSGRVYGVELQTGRLAWSVRADSHPAAIITGTPSLHAGTLYVPVSSNEEAYATSPAYTCCNFRGSVLALDARTGHERWRTWLVGPATIRTKVAGRPDQLGPSGVAVWNSPAIDAARGQLYVATGDNYSKPASELSDSVVALDLKTGRIRWHYQALAGDTWNVDCTTRTSGNCPDDDAPDFDFGAGAVLAKGKHGKPYVMAGQKSGWVYALEPRTGTLAWKTRVGRGSPIGGVNFGLAADAGRLFVPISDRFAVGHDDFPPSPGLYGLDIATGAFAWKAPASDVCNGREGCNRGYGGSITATNGLLIAGGDDGHLRILDNATGKSLWDFDTAREFATVNGIPGRGGSFGGGAAAIAYKGTLIATSGYGYASKMPGNVLLVFAAE